MSTDDSINLPGDAAGTTPSAIQDRAKQDLGSAAETAKRDLGTAAETAKSELDAVAQKAAAEVSNLKQQAGAQIKDATEKAKGFASEQKDFAAGQITGVATAIDRVADELETSEQPMIARYARDLASGLNRFGDTVQNKDVDDLLGMAQSFGRSQPLAFLGAAALAGFVASRFALASAQRLQKTSGTGGYTGNTSSTYGGGSSAYGSGSTGYGNSASSGYGSGSSTVGSSSSYGSGTTGGSTGYGSGSSTTGTSTSGTGLGSTTATGNGSSIGSTFGNRANQSGDE